MSEPQLPGIRAMARLVPARFGLAMPARIAPALARGLTTAAHLLGCSEDAAPDQLAGLPDEAPAWQAVLDRITVRETSFLRQRGWWNELVQVALAPLLATRRCTGPRQISCLSLGCASGAEPYSLALLIDGLLAGEPGWTVTITAVDLSTTALAEAKAGLFDARALREVTPQERARWFQAEGERFRLVSELRDRVTFRLGNLASAVAAGPDDAASALPGAPADLVLCRNVLIHMEHERQPGIARALSALVAPGGTLAVAPVEATAAWFRPLVVRSAGQAILFTRPATGAPVPPRPTASSRPAVSAPIAAPPTTSPPLESRLDRACHLAEVGLLEEARRLCTEVLATSPEADLLMALVCQSLGDLPAAEAAARAGVAAAPASALAHYVSAVVALRTGQTADARAALNRAVLLLADATDHERLGRHLTLLAGDVRRAARRLDRTPEDRPMESRHVRPS